jgi:hypothetical protein
MTTYKLGDEVLVMARVSYIYDDGDLEIKSTPDDYVGALLIPPDSIVGLAPKPEVDWSQVPMGARVRVRDYECEEWRPGRLVSYDKTDDDCGFQVLLLDYDHEVEWFNKCELVEEGDE